MSRQRAPLAAFFALAGAMHFLRPRFYEAIVPPALAERRREVVQFSGLAELAGAAAVLPAATRRFGRWWLIALLVAVFPANVHMAVNPDEVRGLDLRRVPRWTLWARLPLQPLCMAWVWRATR
jgi:uncharacterized membrane protein